ncbi:uncharacterized protein LOC134286115 [Aedes albopictus]|uniref:Helix-turn-helix domain-containing protein n=2 Tax=Aedes albopictus TaxID=7160 RepID=A0ABM1ZIR5_AEDAL
MSVEANQRQLPTENPSAILNATDKVVPPETRILLSLGPKFALPYSDSTQIPWFHLIADVENTLSAHTESTIRDQTRCQIINKIQNFINRNTPFNDPLSKFCKSAVNITKKFIKTNPDVLITEADKGNRTVIMSLADYDSKLAQLIGDTNTYKQVSSDPTGGYERKNNNIVHRLHALKLIDTRTKYTLTSYNAVCPRIYGQPKAHKPNLPLRPVVPNTTSPTYHLCKYIAGILQRSFKSQYNAVDSNTFCEHVNQLTIPPDHVLVSFDAVSLFTNVTKEVVIHDIISMWDEIRENTNINLDLFLEIVDFCVGASCFCFRQKFYVQISGTAMGSPLSPILADIVMENLLRRAITAANILPEYIRKYVDDLFLVLHKDQVNAVLATFNSQNPRILFTCEVEENGRLPFLDLLVIRDEDGSVKTDWYAKPISSGRILNYYSFHPSDQKLAVVNNFIDRVRRLSTTRSREEQELLIHQHLSKNDYPHSLINRLLHQPPRTDNPEKPTIYRSIPYVHGLSSSIKRILHKSNTQIGISHSYKNTVGHLYKNAKDPVSDLSKCNVIYRIDCRDCPSTYIGMTTNKLRNRMYGHQTHVNTLERKLLEGHQYTDPEILQLQEKSALIHHCIQHQHRFNIGNPSIVDITHRKQALQVLEMCHISTTSNTVNHRTDTDNLSCAYAHLLASIKDQRVERIALSTNRNNRRETDDQTADPTT